MTAYMFRAECFTDAMALLTVLTAHASIDAVRIDHMRRGDQMEPDCLVSLRTDQTLAEMRTAAESVVDGHVMLETMQTADHYTGERTG